MKPSAYNKMDPTSTSLLTIKIKSLNRADLLRESKMNDKENSLIPYVTTFNPHNPEILPGKAYD